MLTQMLVILNNYFNSIKVQLEHGLSARKTLALRFQFHKGTIRTLYALGLIAAYLFQFHKGTIRTQVFTQIRVINSLISIP